MAADLFALPLELLSPRLWFNPHQSTGSASLPSKRTATIVPLQQPQQESFRTQRSASVSLDVLGRSVLESLQQGVIILSRNLKPIYRNLKAHEFCQELTDIELSRAELPVTLSEMCYRLLRDPRLDDSLLLMECQGRLGQKFRVSARWLHLPLERDRTVFPSEPSHSQTEPGFQASYILLFLENCDQVLQTELRIEQKKYDLTDREAEIWMLLRQDYTYQDIASRLQISLNTVKTHVKNVYAKKRSCQGQEKFWFSEEKR